MAVMEVMAMGVVGAEAMDLVDPGVHVPGQGGVLAALEVVAASIKCQEVRRLTVS